MFSSNVEFIFYTDCRETVLGVVAHLDVRCLSFQGWCLTSRPPGACCCVNWLQCVVCGDKSWQLHSVLVLHRYVIYIRVWDCCSVFEHFVSSQWSQWRPFVLPDWACIRPLICCFLCHGSVSSPGPCGILFWLRRCPSSLSKCVLMFFFLCWGFWLPDWLKSFEIFLHVKY